MCVELQRVNFDPKNQSWSFWSHNHETSMKMWKLALIFGRELALLRELRPPKTKVGRFGRINTKQASKCGNER